MLGASVVNQGTAVSLTSNTVPSIHNTRLSVTNNIVNGSISNTNITYSYGDHVFTPKGNFTVDNTGTINETSKMSVTQTLTVPLVNKSSVKVTNIIWEIQNMTTTTTNNSKNTYYVDNNTYFNTLLRGLNTLISSVTITNVNIIGNYSISSSYIYDNSQVV